MKLWGIVLLSTLCARIVNETQIKQAIKHLAFRNKLVVEGAGALSLAAAINTRKKHENTVCILSGGSIDHD